MKNNLSFYRHEVDSHNHWKFKTLRKHFGWGGEGRFWALNNMIAASENCTLDLSKKDKKAAIAVELDMTSQEFDKFLEVLKEMCRLVLLKKNKLTTNITQENLSTVSQTRKRQLDYYHKHSTSKTKDFASSDAKDTSSLDKEKQIKEKENSSRANLIVSNALLLDNIKLMQLMRENALYQYTSYFLSNQVADFKAKYMNEKIDNLPALVKSWMRNLPKEAAHL